MGKSRKSYTAEFKREAVKLVRNGLTASQVARDLGIGMNVVSRWVREDEAGAGQAFPGQGRLKTDDAEFEKLRKENSKLRAERDLLKKFAAYMAKRRVVGWSVNAQMTAQLVMDALMTSIWRRGTPKSVLHHADQGSQYSSERFQESVERVRHHLQHEPQRKFLGQCRHRELLLVTQNRANRSQTILYPRPGTSEYD